MSACNHTCPVHCTVEKAENNRTKVARPYQVGDFVQIIGEVNHKGESARISAIGDKAIFLKGIDDMYFFELEIRLIAAVGT